MLQQALLAIGTQIVSIIGGALKGAWGTAIDIMQSGAKAALQFHQEGISLARDLGMGLNQANAYTKVLTERTQVLAQKYGVAASAITAVQRNISEATGKQLLLNNAQAEGFVQANKLVGQETTSKFMDTIINGMGGQVSTVQGAISKAYATAAKQGLNAQKFSKTVAENLSMANRLNFRNGIDGITRMAAMAEKFGLSMKSVETAAGQFTEFDSAIEHSAHLQMLGGSIGASFSNPLENMYESMYDPEAFAKRMEDAMKGMATFDAKKGHATISPINQEFLKNYAKEMGLNAEEVVANAKKMAEVRYKETRFAPELDRYSGSGQDKEARRNFILNNSQVTPEGQLQVNGKNINEITKKEWDDMMAFDGKSDTDILKDQALHLKSIDEALTGSAASVAAAFAKGLELDKNAQDIIQNINKVGTKIQEVAENLGGGTNQALTKMLDWVDKNGSFLKSIADNAISVSKFLADNWGKLLIAIAGWKLLLKPALGANLGGGTTVGGKLGARALGGVNKGFKGLFTTSRDTNIATRMGYANARASGSGRFMSALKAPFRGASLLTTGQKIANVGGAALGIGISAAQGIMAQSAYKDQLDAINRGEWDRERYKTKEEAMAGAQTERNEGVGGAVGSGIGTVIGTVLGGPVGAIIGGAIGKFAGGYIGKNWTKITDWFSNGWDKVVKYFTSIDWGKIGETLISVFVKHWDEISAWFGEKWDTAMASASVLWQNIKEGWDSNIAQPFKEYVIQPIKDGIKWLDENIWQPVKSFFAKVKEGWDKLMAGIQKFLDNPWGAIKQGAKAKYEEAKDWAKDKYNSAKDWIKEKLNFSVGGIVDGNSYSGDRVLTGLNSGEMVLNKNQQAALFNFINEMPSVLSKIGTNGNVSYYNARNYSNSNITDRSLQMSYDTSNLASRVLNSTANTSKTESNNTFNGIQTDVFRSLGNVISGIVSPLSILKNSNDVKAKPVGEKEYIYAPANNDSISNGVTEVTVKDINVNVNGTLKLDAGNFTKNIDINQLLNDSSFVSQLKDLIKESINNDINNGRFMNDIASMRGMPSQVGLWGRK